MPATSGPTSPPPLAFYDPESSSWRTSQTTFDLGLPTSSPTLPASGSMRSGALRARRRSALPTDAAACSSPPLLKTPTAQLAVNGGSQHPDKRKAGGHGPTLADEVEHLLPTPRASDTGTPGRRASQGWRPPLSQVLLPTPRVSAVRTGRGTIMRDSSSPSLEQAMEIARGETPRELHGIANPPKSWHGDRTPPPSIAGKPSSAAPHPGQLSLDVPETA